MKQIGGSTIYYVLIIAVSAELIGYFAYQNYLLKDHGIALENEASKTTANCVKTARKLNGNVRTLNTALETSNGQLASTTIALEDLQIKYDYEKSRMDEFNSQIGNIQGKVGTLEKLSQTDPELLKKYSKVYFLNENYSPKTFAKIGPEYTYKPGNDYLISAQVWPFLRSLLAAAESDKVDIKIISAYRSFYDQSDLKKSYRVTYGSGANKFSADQGYSEHQLGTAVDFTTSQIQASYEGFEDSPASEWLAKNAWKYGFILSYPKDNQYYLYEPWHWRFVGRDLAQILYEDGKNFYDLDQREINKYLVSLFD